MASDPYSSKPVEEWPVAKRKALADEYDIRKHVQPGWLVDAMDIDGYWRVAEVIDLNNGEISLIYDGVPARYNEVVCSSDL